jgi:hypothetical protein
MTLRLFLPQAALLAAFAVCAAGQGVKVAGDPAPAAPKAAAAQPKKKPAAKKKKKKAAAESRYKTRALAEGSENSYKFDENGNAVDAAKKKAAAKARKSSSEPSETKAACSTEEPCSDKGAVKSSEADSL